MVQPSSSAFTVVDPNGFRDNDLDNGELAEKANAYDAVSRSRGIRFHIAPKDQSFRIVLLSLVLCLLEDRGATEKRNVAPRTSVS